MKRHESIITLSRDHHFGLLFCWKLRQGVKKQIPAERIRLYVKYFWDNHLQQHFEEEETILFAGLQGDLIEQTLSEHRYIKDSVNAINNAESVQPYQLNALADILDKHIRFEERILFPYIEKELSKDRLVELGSTLEQLHQTGGIDDYPDEFWI